MQADLLGRKVDVLENLICRNMCNTCAPVEFEEYDKMTESERDNETLKGMCRYRMKITSYLYA